MGKRSEKDYLEPDNDNEYGYEIPEENAKLTKTSIRKRSSVLLATPNHFTRLVGVSYAQQLYKKFQ